ncbi:MAG: winged helix-turn-helix domain-containing protein [Spirochaetes bacterium]|nr:winged helix-turn-helix domain-containing protein [Spirochaetota bacterium]
MSRAGSAGGYTIAFIAADRVLVERIRASLARSPFRFLASEAPPPPGEADLYIVPAEAMGSLALDAGVPVIACGPPNLLRSAFLAGCADYLREPWSADELGLRALRLLERGRDRYAFPWGELSFEGNDLRTPAGLVSLTLRESRVLKQLLAARGSAVPRDALACRVWGKPAAPGSRALDMLVASIRGKLIGAIPAAGPRFILAVSGEGYMIP